MKKIIKDFPSYEIHSNGEVYSFYTNRFMKQSLNGKGYLKVTLTVCGKEITTSIHKLVAIAFLGHNPNGNNTVVHHKDGNKLNNNVDNLELISNGENVTLGWKAKGVTSKYRGVFYAKDRGCWRSFHAKKCYGQHDTEIDAYNSVKHLH